MFGSRLTACGAILVLALIGGCERKETSPQAPAATPQAKAFDIWSVIPSDSTLVATINMERLKESKVWPHLTAALNQDPEAAKEMSALIAQTGLNPLQHIKQVIVSLPADADKNNEFLVALTGQFDEQRMVPYMQTKVQPKGKKIVAYQYAGRYMYSDTQEKKIFATFFGKEVMVLAGPRMIRASLDLFAKKGASIQTNAKIMAMMKQAQTTAAVWGVGLIPPSAKAMASRDPQIQAFASLQSVALSLDVPSNMALTLVAQAGTPDDANQIQSYAQILLGQAKQMPMVMAMGALPFLQQVSIKAQQNQITFAMNLNEAQVADLTTRLQGLAQAGQRPGGAIP